MAYGRTRHDHRRGMVIYFDHASRNAAENYLRCEGVVFRAHVFGYYAVVGLDGRIITVGHRTRRLKFD